MLPTQPQNGNDPFAAYNSSVLAPQSDETPAPVNDGKYHSLDAAIEKEPDKFKGMSREETEAYVALEEAQKGNKYVFEEDLGELDNGESISGSEVAESIANVLPFVYDIKEYINGETDENGNRVRTPLGDTISSLTDKNAGENFLNFVTHLTNPKEKDFWVDAKGRVYCQEWCSIKCNQATHFVKMRVPPRFRNTKAKFTPLNTWDVVPGLNIPMAIWNKCYSLLNPITLALSLANFAKPPYVWVTIPGPCIYIPFLFWKGNDDINFLVQAIPAPIRTGIWGLSDIGSFWKKQALTKDCTLTCLFGGEFTIYDSGQSAKPIPYDPITGMIGPSMGAMLHNLLGIVGNYLPGGKAGLIGQAIIGVADSAISGFENAEEGDVFSFTSFAQGVVSTGVGMLGGAAMSKAASKSKFLNNHFNAVTKWFSGPSQQKWMGRMDRINRWTTIPPMPRHALPESANQFRQMRTPIPREMREALSINLPVRQYETRQIKGFNELRREYGRRIEDQPVRNTLRAARDTIGLNTLGRLDNALTSFDNWRNRMNYENDLTTMARFHLDDQDLAVAVTERDHINRINRLKSENEAIENDSVIKEHNTKTEEINNNNLKREELKNATYEESEKIKQMSKEYEEDEIETNRKNQELIRERDELDKRSNYVERREELYKEMGETERLHDNGQIDDATYNAKMQEYDDRYNKINAEELRREEIDGEIRENNDNLRDKKQRLEDEKTDEKLTWKEKKENEDDRLRLRNEELKERIDEIEKTDHFKEQRQKCKDNQEQIKRDLDALERMKKNLSHEGLIEAGMKDIANDRRKALFSALLSSPIDALNSSLQYVVEKICKALWDEIHEKEKGKFVPPPPLPALPPGSAYA